MRPRRPDHRRSSPGPAVPSPVHSVAIVPASGRVRDEQETRKSSQARDHQTNNNTMKLRGSHRSTITSRCLALLLAGCTLTLPPLQPKAVDSYLHKQEQNGLAVAIEPMTNHRAIEEQFGTNLLDDDILAVLVVSENRNPSISYLLSKDRFSLSLGSAVIGGASPANPVSAWLGTAVAILGIIGGKMATDATVIGHNLKTKELQTNTISPGKGARGFVYFQLPKGTRLPTHCSIRLEAVDLQSQGVNRFEFVFDLKGD